MHTAAYIGPKARSLTAGTAKRCIIAAAAICIAGSLPVAAQRSAAENSDGDLLLGSPTRSIEATEPAATVASEAPLQRLIQLECSDDTGQDLCTGGLPLVQQSQRIVIQFVSCDAGANGNIAFSSALPTAGAGPSQATSSLPYSLPDRPVR